MCADMGLYILIPEKRWEKYLDIFYICMFTLGVHYNLCCFYYCFFPLSLNSNSTCIKIDPGDLGNQRPVSLMPALGKLVLMVMKREKEQLSIQRNKACCKKINMGFQNKKSYFTYLQFFDSANRHMGGGGSVNTVCWNFQ